MSQEKLFAELATDLYRYAMYKLGNKENAEDVVSETFVRLLQQPEQKKISKPWTIGILRNVIMEKYREIAKSGFDLDETLLPGKTQHEAQALDEELLKLLTAELSNLENETREVIVLKTWEELRFEEIAEVMSLNVNNVKAKYYRGIEDLKMKLNTEDKDKKARSVALPVILLGIAQLAKAQTFTPSAEFLSALWQQTGPGLGSLIINSNNMTSTVKDLLARKLVWAAMTAGVVVVAATAIVGIQLSKSSNIVTPGETQTPTENAPAQPDTGTETPHDEKEDIYLLFSSYDYNTLKDSYYTISTSDTTPKTANVPSISRGVGTTFVGATCDRSNDTCTVSSYDYTSRKTTILFTVEGAFSIAAITPHPDGSLYFIAHDSNNNNSARLMRWNQQLSTIFTWKYIILGDALGELSINVSTTGKYILVINTLGLNNVAMDSDADSLLLLNSKGDIIYRQTKSINQPRAGFLSFNAAETVAYLKVKSDNENGGFVVQTLSLKDFSFTNGDKEFEGIFATFNQSRSVVASVFQDAYPAQQYAKLNILNTITGKSTIVPDLSYPIWASENTFIARRQVDPSAPEGGYLHDKAIVVVRLLADGQIETQDVFTLPEWGGLGVTVLTKAEFDALRK